MSRNSTEPSRADHGQPHHYFVPAVHFYSCANAKIYVNTIINPPHPYCSSLPSKNASTENRDHDIPKLSLGEPEPYFIDPHKGGRVNIYYGKKNDNLNSLPMISVEIQKLSSAEIGERSSVGASEIKPLEAYVITVHTNNVSGEGAPSEPVPAGTVLDDMIKADNVVLNSAGGINVGPGAGASNNAPFTGCCNSLNPKK